MDEYEMSNELSRKIAWGAALVGFGFTALVLLVRQSERGGWMIFIISGSVAVMVWGIAYVIALILSKPEQPHRVVFSRPTVYKAPTSPNGNVLAAEPLQPAWSATLNNRIVGDMIYVDDNRLEKLEEVTIPELHKLAQARYEGRLPEVSERSLDGIGIPRSSGRAKAIKDWLQACGYVVENGQRQAAAWTARADRLFLPPPPQRAGEGL